MNVIRSGALGRAVRPSQLERVTAKVAPMATLVAAS